MQSQTEKNLTIDTADKSTEIKNILVLGLGNILLKDEGVGVRVIEALSDFAFASNVEVVDGGTAGLDVVLPRKNLHKLIIIDAIKADREPGTIYETRFRADDKDAIDKIFCKKESHLSLHQLGLLGTISIAKKMNTSLEEIIIFGVEPDEISCGLELTEAVKTKIPKVVDLILEEIKDAVY